MGAQDTALWCELDQDKCPPLRRCTFQIGTQAYYSGNMYNFLSFIKRAERDQEGDKFQHHLQIFKQDRNIDDISMQHYCCSHVWVKQTNGEFNP